MSSRIQLSSCFMLVILVCTAVADDGSDHENCNRCNLSNEGCDICYANCTRLTIISCEDTSGPMDQSVCIHNCCSQDSSSTQFDQQYLNRCLVVPNKNQTQARSAVYYVVLATGSVALFILIVVIIRAIYRRSRSSQPSPARNSNRFVSAQILVDHPTISSFNYDDVPNTREYPLNYKDIIIDPTNSCCICLDGDVNSITKCGHVFHLNCLASWAARKNICPLCNYADIHEAKIFCKTCKAELQNINFRRIRTNVVEQLNNKKCENCSK